ncbi:hypothetical protein KUTeg_013785 [Tegillarca granosa]|uniref:Sulfotransferase domain-containing protein n=1 Tax=Tegillarca granosa TaxID=220873 RepID=A0ABQ9EX62_TEGGR|nr:hypothetical protein KUTeg_013785 [Tegillarca granosa]
MSFRIHVQKNVFHWTIFTQIIILITVNSAFLHFKSDNLITAVEMNKKKKKATEDLGWLINIKVRDLYFYGNDLILQNFDPTKVMEELPKMKRRDDDVVLKGENVVEIRYARGKTLRTITCQKLRHNTKFFISNISSDTINVLWFLGTNWTWEIVNMLVRESRDYQRDRKTPTLLEFQSQDCLDKMALPRILSTHLRFHHIPDDKKKRKCKIIYIQRNPKDVAVSIRHFNKCQLMLIFHGMITSMHFYFLHLWRQHPLKNCDVFLKTSGKQIIILKMHKNIDQNHNNPFEEITRMAKFLGVSTDRKFINEVVKKTEFSNMKNSKLEFISQTDNHFIAYLYKIIHSKTHDDGIQKKRVLHNSVHNHKLQINIELVSAFSILGKIADWKNHFTIAQMNILTNLCYKYHKSNMLPNKKIYLLITENKQFLKWLPSKRKFSKFKQIISHLYALVVLHLRLRKFFNKDVMTMYMISVDVSLKLKKKLVKPYLTSDIYENIASSGSQRSKLYGMAKVHKQQCPLRPVSRLI